ncbi:MAG: transcriptional regulator [Spirochaetales bacterium]|nr:transcriptional regulator [Spirochaetales bacterium]
MFKKESTFEEALTKEFFTKVFSAVFNADDELLSFNEVSSLVKPTAESYKGIQPVPISQILGSEGRYRDFNRHFFPRKRHLKARWERINRAYKKGVILPPVKLYEIGGKYFVRDGNHRVSVALIQGIEFIDAEVTRLETGIKFSENMTMEEVRQKVIEYEQKEFYKTTKIKKYRTDADIRFTAPGRFDAAMEHIYGHKYFLNLDKDEEIPLKKAVVSWYDRVYTPIVNLIISENILQRFPGRTNADLYIWIVRYWHDLKERYGNRYSRKKAVKKFSEKFGRNLWQITKDRIAGFFRRFFKQNAE